MHHYAVLWQNSWCPWLRWNRHERSLSLHISFDTCDAFNGSKRFTKEVFDLVRTFSSLNEFINCRNNASHNFNLSPSVEIWTWGRRLRVCNHLDQLFSRGCEFNSNQQYLRIPGNRACFNIRQTSLDIIRRVLIYRRPKHADNISWLGLSRSTDHNVWVFRSNPAGYQHCLDEHCLYNVWHPLWALASCMRTCWQRDWSWQCRQSQKTL